MIIVIIYRIRFIVRIIVNECVFLKIFLSDFLLIKYDFGVIIINKKVKVIISVINWLI